MPALPEHQDVHRYLTRELERDDLTLVLTPMVLHELMHVITDKKRFEPPVSMPEALALVRLYLDASNVECLAIDAQSVQRTLHLLDEHRLGRKRIADSLLAATLLRHGVHELITCDPADFQLFDQLECIDPRKRRP
jgi:predicted nucleic acid-binding protein